MSRNIEKLVETAFVEVLEANIVHAPTAYSVRRGYMASEQTEYPCIFVSVNTAGNEDWDALRDADAFTIEMDIGVETQLRNDKDRVVLDNIIGDIRDVLARSTLLTELSSCEYLTFMAVLVQSSEYEMDDNKINRAYISIEVKVIYGG